MPDLTVFGGISNVSALRNESKPEVVDVRKCIDRESIETYELLLLVEDRSEDKLNHNFLRLLISAFHCQIVGWVIPRIIGVTLSLTETDILLRNEANRRLNQLRILGFLAVSSTPTVLLPSLALLCQAVNASLRVRLDANICSFRNDLERGQNRLVSHSLQILLP
jgi:hypothetical protein